MTVINPTEALAITLAGAVTGPGSATELRDVASVADYGAVVNDATKATTNDVAFAAAIADLPAGGGGLLVPIGEWFVSQRVAIDASNVVLYGQGPASKITLVPGTTTNVNLLRFNSTGSNTPARIHDSGFCFLTLNGNGADTDWAVGGLHGTACLYAVDDPVSHHIRIDNGLDYCITFHGCTGEDVASIIARTCYWQLASNPINIEGLIGGSRDANDSNVHDCFVRNTATIAAASASAAASVATYAFGSAHKLNAGQFIKVTGFATVAYNGFWQIASTPTATTFTVALGSTPAADLAGGTVGIRADRGIYCGGQLSKRLIAHHNDVHGCVAAIDQELGGTGSAHYDSEIADNICWEFSHHGVGASDTSLVAELLTHVIKVANNTIRGVVGTTDFGRAGSGSVYGVICQCAEIADLAGNMISDVLEGVYGGSGSVDVAESRFSVTGGKITLASDATGAAVHIDKQTATQSLKRLIIKGVDGDGNQAGNYGALIEGRVQNVDHEGNDWERFGRSGLRLKAFGGVGPSKVRIRGGRSIDNNCSSAASASDRVGYQIDSGCDDVELVDAVAYDTRTPKLQEYGAAVGASATNVRIRTSSFTGNLLGEVSDASGVATIVPVVRFVERAKWGV